MDENLARLQAAPPRPTATGLTAAEAERQRRARQTAVNDQRLVVVVRATVPEDDIADEALTNWERDLKTISPSLLNRRLQQAVQYMGKPSLPVDRIPHVQAAIDQLRVEIAERARVAADANIVRWGRDLRGRDQEELRDNLAEAQAYINNPELPPDRVPHVQAMINQMGAELQRQDRITANRRAIARGIYIHLTADQLEEAIAGEVRDLNAHPDMPAPLDAVRQHFLNAQALLADMREREAATVRSAAMLYDIAALGIDLGVVPAADVPANVDMTAVQLRRALRINLGNEDRDIEQLTTYLDAINGLQNIYQQILEDPRLQDLKQSLLEPFHNMLNSMHRLFTGALRLVGEQVLLMQEELNLPRDQRRPLEDVIKQETPATEQLMLANYKESIDMSLQQLHNFAKVLIRETSLYAQLLQKSRSDAKPSMGIINNWQRNIGEHTRSILSTTAGDLLLRERTWEEKEAKRNEEIEKMKIKMGVTDERKLSKKDMQEVEMIVERKVPEEGGLGGWIRKHFDARNKLG
jgi:hypothetical protein